MCGRFTLTASRPDVLGHYGLQNDPPLAIPRYNIAPLQAIAVVRMTKESRELKEVRWGLVPQWAKQPESGFSMINARAETVDTKPAFRALLRRRRCLIPTDGFYEWRGPQGNKQPWRFVMKRGLFSFAGLWDHWQGPDNQVIESATIITTDANDLVRPCHDRMPVIIDPADYEFWLDPGIAEPEALRPLFAPHPVSGMDAYPVIQKVGRTTFNDPEAIRPLYPPPLDPEL
jgi:putative SOS response-associated peptidase YedK